jgi:hypothetical protein
MKTKTTIKAKVLSYLKQGHSLDNAKAMSMFGYFRLPVAIQGLRRDAHVIKTESCEGPEGNTFTFYRYQGQLAIGMEVLCPGGRTAHVVDAHSYPGEAKVRFTNGCLGWRDVKDLEIVQ